MAFPIPSSAQKKKPSVSLKWTIVGELPALSGHKKALGLAGPIVGASNGILVVGGGANFPDSMPWLGGKKKYYNDLYVYKKNKNDSLILFKSFRLPFALAYSANISTNKGIVVAGGENENGSSDKVLLIKWMRASKNLLIKTLPNLPFKVTNAAASANGNKIYLAGGERNTIVSDAFLVLDLDNIEAGWKELPSLPKPLSYVVMATQSDGRDNCIYIIGGRKKSRETLSDFYLSTFKFNLRTNQWQEMQPLAYGLSAGTGIALRKNYILLFGGDKGETFHKVETLILDISKEKDEEKKKLLNQQRIAMQSSHPGFSKEVLLYNTITNEWTVSGFIPYDVPVTTTAIKWDKDVMIPGGEIKAGVRTPNILAVEIKIK
jgi:N-acetylneuraminate epimerase